MKDEVRQKLKGTVLHRSNEGQIEAKIQLKCP